MRAVALRFRPRIGGGVMNQRATGISNFSEHFIVNKQPQFQPTTRARAVREIDQLLPSTSFKIFSGEV
jgi:hypothetical protein